MATEQMTIDTTVRRVNPPGRFEFFAGGGLAAVIIFSVGVFVMVVPIIGWAVGPALMITAGLIAVGHVIGMFRIKPGYEGDCPYCGSATPAGEPESVSQCETCKNQFIHRDNRLWKTEE